MLGLTPHSYCDARVLCILDSRTSRGNHAALRARRHLNVVVVVVRVVDVIDDAATSSSEEYRRFRHRRLEDDVVLRADLTESGGETRSGSLERTRRRSAPARSRLQQDAIRGSEVANCNLVRSRTATSTVR